MKTITLTDHEGDKLSGHIPEGWHEVPLSAFMDYHARMENKPKALSNVILASALTTLPEDALDTDVAFSPFILLQMPWVDRLPEAAPLRHFTHQGKTYEHVGNLEKIDISQFEALLTFLETAVGDSIAATPNLLAVLYKERKKKQDADSIEAAAEAFRSLPMDKAWGALAFFLTSSQPLAQNIHAFSRSRGEALAAVKTLESLAARPSPTRSSRTAAWLVKRYTRSVRVLLQKS